MALFILGDRRYSREGFMRVHCRGGWYTHYYTPEELKGIAQKILETEQERVYLYFINDHAMLENARSMLEILR